MEAVKLRSGRLIHHCRLFVKQSRSIIQRQQDRDTVFEESGWCMWLNHTAAPLHSGCYGNLNILSAIVSSLHNVWSEIPFRCFSHQVFLQRGQVFCLIFISAVLQWFVFVISISSLLKTSNSFHLCGFKTQKRASEKIIALGNGICRLDGKKEPPCRRSRGSSRRRSAF